ncbi:MAG: M14 family metallopeptidase, partial [Flavobacteriaceae bacterium]|nr:M14 family metallopeptidase [Flavobacteriaceae bacterium]
MSFLKIGSCIFFLCTLVACNKDKSITTNDFRTVFEKTAGLETATYPEIIGFYQQLAADYSTIAIYEMEDTDSGKPLHLVTFNPNRSFESEFSTAQKQNILLINNGIHPGESDGIDASMMLLRDLAQQKIKTPQQTIIAVIPVYNIGGALNRNSTTRTNQNGPKAYG